MYYNIFQTEEHGKQLFKKFVMSFLDVRNDDWRYGARRAVDSLVSGTDTRFTVTIDSYYARKLLDHFYAVHKTQTEYDGVFLIGNGTDTLSAPLKKLLRDTYEEKFFNKLTNLTSAEIFEEVQQVLPEAKRRSLSKSRINQIITKWDQQIRWERVKPKLPPYKEGSVQDFPDPQHVAEANRVRTSDKLADMIAAEIIALEQSRQTT